MTDPHLLPSTWAPGSLIPGTVYRIIRPIGQGGMGEVYEVEHDMLGTRRALKVLVKHYAGREDLAERLRVEARGLARLKHPNLVEVYDLGTAADGRIFFAMELLDGVTLRTMLRERGRLSMRTSVELVVQVLAGLHAAHVAGILHRDVKPENVFVCRDGTVKLLDFGVAKAIDVWMPEQKITGAGMTVGTPRYMSPEQAEGGPVDARTDVYATGQMLWEMLAGRPAFEETDPYDLARAKRERGVPPLAQIAGLQAAPSLARAVDLACRTDLATRHASAEAFVHALRAAVGSPTPVPLPASAAVSPGNTQAYLAGAGQTPPGASLDMGGTIPVPRGTVQELTERVDAIQSVNRDACTQARSGLRVRGPSGTELLPAVAARHEPHAIVAPSVPPAADSARATDRVEHHRGAARNRTGPFGIPLTSWLAGAAAFIIPVLIAAALAVWQLGTPAPAPTVSLVSSASPSATVEPTAEPGTLPPTPLAAESTSPPASSASAAELSPPPPPAATKTSRPAAVPKPPRTQTTSAATKKMPGSGL